MDINQYLETNCGINDNNSLIENEINQFEFYSLKNYEILESIHLFKYSKLFNYYYTYYLFDININFEDFILNDYQQELYKINQEFINNNLEKYENKYDEFDKLIKDKKDEINKLSTDTIKKEIEDLNNEKKEISIKLTNITSKTFEMISLNDEIDKIDKTIKIKLTQLDEIPIEIKKINKDIDNVKKELNTQLILIKIFQHFPLQDYHLFIEKQIDRLQKLNHKNRCIRYQNTVIYSIHYYFIIQYILTQYIIYDKFDILSLLFILILTLYYTSLF